MIHGILLLKVIQNITMVEEMVMVMGMGEVTVMGEDINSANW